MLSKVKLRIHISISTQIANLKLSSSILFQTLMQMQRKFPLFHNPFNSVIQDFPLNLQLEVINLQCDDLLKGKYQEKKLTILHIPFW